MRRLIPASPCLLLALLSFVPLCWIVGGISGYDFFLASDSISSVLLAACSCVGFFFLKKPEQCSLLGNQIALSLLPVAASVGGFFFVLRSDWRPTVLFVMICCGCAMGLMLRLVQITVLTVGSALLTAVLLSLLLLVSWFDWILQDFGVTTTVRTIASPQNTYAAKVIDSDQGALGGDTYVDVYDTHSGLDLLLFRFSKSPIRVYSGEWGEGDSLKLLWKDEHTLLVDQTEHHIP